MPDFDPYYKWLGIPRSEQPAHHYRLLGVDLYEADPDVINAAAQRQSAILQQAGSGKYAALSQKLLKEVAVARVCLRKASMKRAYDAQLREVFEPIPLAEVVEDEPHPLTFLQTPPSEFDPSLLEPAVTSIRPTQPQNLPLWLRAMLFLVMFSLPGVLWFQFLRNRPEPLLIADSDEAREAEQRSFRAPSDVDSSKRTQKAPTEEPPNKTVASPKSKPKPDQPQTKTSPPTAPRTNPAQTAPPATGLLGPKSPQKDPAIGTPPFQNSIAMDFLFIPKGEFQMGASTDDENALEDERPRHRVSITRGFFLSKYETTNADYAAVMQNAKSSNPATAKLPVTNRSWDEASEFCRRLSRIEKQHYRLPTEAEWELACRAGAASKWSSGNEAAQLNDSAWFGETAAGEVHAVGTKQPNAWGFHDLHGNVSEWCFDPYASNVYEYSRLQDPIGFTASVGALRVLRGGSWDQPATSIRSSSRAAAAPGTRNAQVGFRVVLEADNFGIPLDTAQPSHFSTLEPGSTTNVPAGKTPLSSSEPITPGGTEKTPARPPTVPLNAIAWNGHWYWFPDQKVAFKEALRIATSRKGRLVAISSADENAFVAENLQGPTLIGCARFRKGWLNSTAAPQRFFNWDSTQPSDGRGEDYVAMFPTGLWHDYSEDVLHFAVEWGTEE